MNMETIYVVRRYDDHHESEVTEWSPRFEEMYDRYESLARNPRREVRLYRAKVPVEHRASETDTLTYIDEMLNSAQPTGWPILFYSDPERDYDIALYTKASRPTLMMLVGDVMNELRHARQPSLQQIRKRLMDGQLQSEPRI